MIRGEREPGVGVVSGSVVLTKVERMRGIHALWLRFFLLSAEAKGGVFKATQEKGPDVILVYVSCQIF